MHKNFLSRTSGLLLLGLLLIFSIIAWNREPQGVTTQQVASGACLSASDARFVFDFAGYVNHEDGTTALTYSVTNPNKKDISYVAFGTGDWTRVEPSNAVTTSLELGTYRVEWTNNRGNPGFTSVKYETHFGGFSKGATDIFTLVVSGFDPEATVQVEAKAGRDRGRLSFALGDPACDKTPPTPTPTLPFSPLPTPTPTPEGGVVLPTEPAVAECVFEPPAGGLPADEPVIPLIAYSFSGPQVVLTNTAPIGIEQWLPDNETLMVTRYTRYGNQLELLNVNTKELTLLLEPDRAIKAPRWIAEEETIIWSEIGTPNHEPGYWVHSFNPLGIRRLTVDWDINHDVAPNGKEAILMAPPGGTQPLIWNQESKTLRALPIDLVNWRYNKPGILYPLLPFNVYWHPAGDKVLFSDGTWVFLYDLKTDSGCELDMRSIAGDNDSILRASWSPNGRYLLAQLTQDPPYTSIRGPYALVMILDTYTGNSIQYDLGTVVYSFSWAPDNQTVIIEEESDREIDIFPLSIFYLFNIHSGEHTPVLTEGTTLGATGRRVLWSPNGKTVAYQCKNTAATDSVPYLDRICINQITMNQ